MGLKAAPAAAAAAGAGARRDSDDSDGARGGAAIAQFAFKVAVLGEPGVGKTSLLRRVCAGAAGSSGGGGGGSAGGGPPPPPTRGVDFYVRRFTLPDGASVALQLWDVGGAVRAGSAKMAANYLFGVHAALLVYDPASPPTLAALPAWLALLSAACASTGPPLLALVAGKADQLATAARVTAGEHAAFAAAHGAFAYCASARSGRGLDAALFRTAADLAGSPVTNADVDAALGVAAGAPASTSGGGADGDADSGGNIAGMFEFDGEALVRGGGGGGGGRVRGRAPPKPPPPPKKQKAAGGGKSWLRALMYDGSGSSGGGGSLTGGGSLSGGALAWGAAGGGGGSGKGGGCGCFPLRRQTAQRNNG
jgi:hypothetical protein